MSDFKKRFGWHIILNLTLIFVVVYGYAIFSNAFVQVPNNYQWVLALFSPYFGDYIFKIMNFAIAKAAGEEGRGRYAMKFVPLHYIVTKHAFFLSIIVGGVATPLSSYCIMATDFAKTVYSGGKIVYRRKVKNDTNVKGKVTKVYNIKYKSLNSSQIFHLLESAMKLVIGERKALNVLTYLPTG